MNNAPQNQIDARTVGIFFTMNEEDLLRFATELDIDMNVRELQFCQSYFKHAYRRPPIVAELRFIAAYLHAKKSSPLSLLPFEITFDEKETADAFTDLMQKRAVAQPNQKIPANALALLNVAGEYLKRAGHAPRKNDILCLNEAELALMTSSNTPRLSLSLGDRTAVLVDPDKSKLPMPATVLAIDEADPTLLPQITSKIMEITAHIGVMPLMQVGKEGLFSVLSALPGGIEIFASLSPIENENNPYLAINELYKDALLIALPEAVVPSLLATGIPLKSVGNLLATDAVIIHHPHATVSLDKRLLHELNALASSRLRARIPQKSPANYTISEVKSETEILCGITCTGDAIPALLALLGTAFKTGIRSKKLRLHATLACNKKNLPLALGAIADLHRVVAELALASQPARLLHDRNEQPCLTVVLAAPLSEQCPPSDAKIAAFEDAAARTDYAALRALLY